jgi:hypothetical protein
MNLRNEISELKLFLKQETISRDTVYEASDFTETSYTIDAMSQSCF